MQTPPPLPVVCTTLQGLLAFVRARQPPRTVNGRSNVHHVWWLQSCRTGVNDIMDRASGNVPGPGSWWGCRPCCSAPSGSQGSAPAMRITPISSCKLSQSKHGAAPQPPRSNTSYHLCCYPCRASSRAQDQPPEQALQQANHVTALVLSRPTPQPSSPDSNVDSSPSTYP